MKITSLSAQVRNPDRVNINIDGSYRFSLDISQITDLGIKVGREISEEELAELEVESQFGKLYARALEYSLMRPHSIKEVRDYLWRKTRDSYYMPRRRPGQKIAPERRLRPGVSPTVAQRVLDRLVDRGYVDDVKFANYWVEQRHQTKGASRRKLQQELMSKGVASSIITEALEHTTRNDSDELAKIIFKKRRRYDDDQKFMQYLARQGFGFDDIKTALADYDDSID